MTFVTIYFWRHAQLRFSSFSRAPHHQLAMAVLEDGMGSPLTLGDISEALSEEEVDDDDDDDDDEEDDDAFLERMQRERQARLNNNNNNNTSSSSRRPESAARIRPESARRPASSGGVAMSTGRGRSGTSGDMDFVRTPARPATAESPSSTGRSLSFVGGDVDGSVGRGSRTTNNSSGSSRTTGGSSARGSGGAARPVSAVRRDSRGVGAGYVRREHLTNHHNEFQPYDPYDPLDGDPVSSSSGGGDGRDAYGAPGRMHNSPSSRRATTAEKKEISPSQYYGSGKLSRSPYAQSLSGSLLRARGDNSRKGGLITPGDDDIMGSTVGSNASSVLGGGGGRGTSARRKEKESGAAGASAGFGIGNGRVGQHENENKIDSRGGGGGRAGGAGGKSPDASPLEWWPKDSRRERERLRKAFDTSPAPLSYPMFAEPRATMTTSVTTTTMTTTSRPNTAGTGATRGGGRNSRGGAWQQHPSAVASPRSTTGGVGGVHNKKQLSQVSGERAAAVYLAGSGGARAVMARLSGRSAGSTATQLSPLLSAVTGATGAKEEGAGPGGPGGPGGRGGRGGQGRRRCGALSQPWPRRALAVSVARVILTDQPPQFVEVPDLGQRGGK